MILSLRHRINLAIDESTGSTSLHHVALTVIQHGSHANFTCIACVYKFHIRFYILCLLDLQEEFMEGLPVYEYLEVLDP